MTSYEVIDRCARRQHGLVTWRQLELLGPTRRQIEWLLATDQLARVRHGVYRLCGVPATWRQVAMAAVLAAGDGAVLSHRSVAWLWDMLDPYVDAGPIEITVTRRLRVVGVTAHQNALAPAEITKRHGIPVTTAARTVMDLAHTTDAASLGQICDEALRRRLFTIGQLHKVVARHAGPGRRRLAPLHTVLAERVPGYDPGANDWEKRMDRMWDRLGLPPAVRQHRIKVGTKHYVVDRAIVDLRIAVEWNGYTPHGLRANFDRDSNRRAELAAAGWYPLDFTSRSSPKLICNTVLAVVEERRAARKTA